MTRDLATDARGEDERFKGDRAGLVSKSLVVEFENGDTGRSVDEGLEVVKIEVHRDHIESRRGEANGNGAHDRDGDVAFGLRDLLGHVRSGVETGEDPVAVDEVDEVGQAVRFPSRRVDKGREYESGGLVGFCSGGDGDEGDEK